MMATGQKILDKLAAAKGQPVQTVETTPDGRGVFFSSGARVGIIAKDAGLIEQLVATGKIVSPLDSIGTSGARYHIALRLRDLYEGAQVKGLKSPSWSSSGGGGTTDITSYQLDCMRAIGRVRDGMPVREMADVLERAVCWDEWSKRAPLDKAARIKVLQCAIDYAGAALNYLQQDAVLQRWSHEAWLEQNRISPPARSRIRVARA